MDTEPSPSTATSINMHETLARPATRLAISSANDRLLDAINNPQLLMTLHARYTFELTEALADELSTGEARVSGECYMTDDNGETSDMPVTLLDYDAFYVKCTVATLEATPQVVLEFLFDDDNGDQVLGYMDPLSLTRFTLEEMDLEDEQDEADVMATAYTGIMAMQQSVGTPNAFVRERIDAYDQHYRGTVSQLDRFARLLSETSDITDELTEHTRITATLIGEVLATTIGEYHFGYSWFKYLYEKMNQDYIKHHAKASREVEDRRDITSNVDRTLGAIAAAHTQEGLSRQRIMSTNANIRYVADGTVLSEPYRTIVHQWADSLTQNPLIKQHIITGFKHVYAIFEQRIVDTNSKVDEIRSVKTEALTVLYAIEDEGLEHIIGEILDILSSPDWNTPRNLHRLADLSRMHFGADSGCTDTERDALLDLIKVHTGLSTDTMIMVRADSTMLYHSTDDFHVTNHIHTKATVEDIVFGTYYRFMENGVHEIIESSTLPSVVIFAYTPEGKKVTSMIPFDQIQHLSVFQEWKRSKDTI